MRAAKNKKHGTKHFQLPPLPPEPDMANISLALKEILSTLD